MNTIAQAKSIAAIIALTGSMTAMSILTVTPVAAQSISDPQPEVSLSVVMEFLSNTTPDKVEAAVERLVAPNATYISLNFDNPELQKILPWTGTNYGPTAFSGLFLQLADYWETEDFTVTDQIASGEDVAIFGTFTYRSLEVDHVFTSPFSIYAKVRDGKITYFQFMEDTYASANSFRQSGSWTVKTLEDTAPFTVGEE